MIFQWKISMHLFYLLLPLFSLLYSLNNAEIMIEKIMKGQSESNQSETILNNDPEFIYLKGLTEIDGEKSFNLFLDYYNKYPNRKYSDDAVVKIAEYYYSKGLYNQAANWYKKIPIKYSESNFVNKSISYHLNSLVIAGKVDSARYYTKTFKEKYPSLKFNDDFLPKSSLTKENKNNSQSKINKGYTIQIGLFKKYQSALYKKKILLNEGFSSRIDEIILDHQRFYSLRVGSFSKKENAIKEEKRLKSRIGIYNSMILELE